MTGRLKPCTLTILAILLFALLAGPPLAMAAKLPTVCNIFHKSMDKGCHGGQRHVVTKVQDTSFESHSIQSAETVLVVFSLIPGCEERLFSSPVNTAISPFTPLRC